ncbi:hypothetical protein BJV77DRAFT_1059960 [Russula vinacea]|nr:hypothetical protein BJV77DRAFT_1059960 [Russula vinacea]
MASSSTGEASPVFSAESSLNPICSRPVPEQLINQHIDANCRDAIPGPSSSTPKRTRTSSARRPVAPIFKTGGPATTKHDDLSTPGLQQPSQRPTTNRPSQKRKLSGDAPSAHHRASGVSLVKQGKAKATIGSRLQAASPLAERLRPSTLDEFVGHVHLTGPDSFLSTLTEKGAVGSIILWGPPGELSATAVGINDVRPIFDEAKGNLQLTGSRTILFLDEIHRFTRSQQDIFLPFLERGVVQLIGTTTENPSYKLNAALLSRCRIFVLERLTDEEIIEIIKSAIARVHPQNRKKNISPAALPIDISSPSSPPPSSPVDSSQTNQKLESSVTTPMSLQPLFPKYPHVTDKIITSMASLAAGDARTALSLLEQILLAPAETPESALLDSMRHSVATSYDRSGDARYNLISALQKSIRGGQADQDPMYIARRLVVCASEDIGMADPHALPLAMAALQACQAIGMPECRINLAHVVTYLSEAPKNGKQDMTLPVPMAMRNAPTRLMKELGYGKDYMYQPQFAHPVTNEYLPPQIVGKIILREEGDPTEKKWDEGALRQWEEIENSGEAWAGRPSSS